MPLFLDIHKHVPGLTKEAVEEAHAKDLEIQGNYNVKYLSTGTIKIAGRYSAL